MSDPKTTSVVVHRTTWARLNSLRRDPKDSMDNVIVRLLDAQGIPTPEDEVGSGGRG